MIILDTNVVSELMKAAPFPPVVDWVAQQAAASLYTTSVTEAEILHGVLLLPAGRRRNNLQAAAEGMFSHDFGGRVLPFGSDAARAYASIAASRRRAGRPISHFDAQIAAIGRAARATMPLAIQRTSMTAESSWSIPGCPEIPLTPGPRLGRYQITDAIGEVRRRARVRSGGGALPGPEAELL